MRPNPKTKELTLNAVHPGSAAEEAREATGWYLKAAKNVGTTDPPGRESSKSYATSRENRRGEEGEGRMRLLVKSVGQGIAMVVENAAQN